MESKGNEQPLIMRLPKRDFEKIKNNLSSEVLYSNIIAQPEFNMGFHCFIHRTKNYMNITKKLSTKDKFYYIVNPYESDDELLKQVSEFLNIKDKTPEILSRAFFKMWEMIFVFNLAEGDKLSYSALAEGPGAFLQSVLHYRKKYHSIKSDKYNSITINPEEGKNIDVSRSFLGYYVEEHPDLIVPHKTYKSSVAKKYKSRDNGDLTDFKTISNFRKEVKKGKQFSKLVSADGGFAWVDENYQEQEAYPLVIGQILSGLMVQDKNGNMVVKLFETFTKISLKLINLMCSMYNEVYMYKPYFSRVSNSERYLVCKGFKFDQKKDKKTLDVIYSDLEKILKQFDTNKYIVDIFDKMEIDNEFLNPIRVFNIQVANKQQAMINNIVAYIKGNNYFGDKYHGYLEEHKKALKYWVEHFLPDKSELKKAQEKWNKNVKKVLDHQKDEVEILKDFYK